MRLRAVPARRHRDDRRRRVVRHLVGGVDRERHPLARHEALDEAVPVARAEARADLAAVGRVGGQLAGSRETDDAEALEIGVVALARGRIPEQVDVRGPDGSAEARDPVGPTVSIARALVVWRVSLPAPSTANTE